MKKSEPIKRRKLVSLNALHMKKLVVLGGKRGLTTTHEKAKSGNMTNPRIRTVQPNPNEELLSILDRAIGMTTPPIDDPDMASPNAAPRFLSKYWDIAPKAGNVKRPRAAPISTPWASINCQYSSHRLTIIKAKTYSKVAGRSSCLHVSALLYILGEP